jgi:hypothetical protein
MNQKLRGIYLVSGLYCPFAKEFVEPAHYGGINIVPLAFHLENGTQWLDIYERWSCH